MRSPLWPAGFALALALVSAGARAQAPTAASSALAEALFQEGRDLFKQERYPEACAKFAESQRLEPKLGTLLRLALCHEKAGLTATAWAEYTSAAVIARREGQKDREEFARKQVEALAPGLAHVVVRAPSPPPGLTITLDDKPVGAVVLGMPLPIDPGKHRVIATAPGKKDWTTAIEIPPSKAEIVVEIPALEEAFTAPAPPPTVVVQSPPPPPPPRRDVPWTVAYVGFGVAATGILVGSITGGVAWAKAGAIKAACTGGHCPLEQQGPLDTVDALANASNVAFAAGAAGAVTGVVGLVVALRPVVGPGMVGIQGRF